VKPGEGRTWVEEAKRFGRGDDIVHIRRDGNEVFDPLFYESRRSKYGPDLNNIAAMVTTISRVGKPHVQAGDQSGEFFSGSAEDLVRYSGYLLVAAGENLSLLNIQRVLDSAPQWPVPEDPRRQTDEMKHWLEDSYIGNLLRRIVARVDDGQVPEDQWRGAEQAEKYLLFKWPQLGGNTRTSIEQTLNTLVAKLITPPYDKLLAGGRMTWCPEQTFTDQKLVICDISTLEHGKSAELLQVAYKLAFQSAIARRDVNRYPRPVALVADEFQKFVVPQDGEFQEVCRESRGIVCYATQSLQGLARQIHEHKPGSGVHALVGNIGNRIILQCGDEETVKWVAEYFGKQYEQVPEVHGQHFSIKNDYRWKVEPSTLMTLPVPTPEFPFAVGCVYRGGQPWLETGEPWHFHAFPRL
jgi:hypothetical protein